MNRSIQNRYTITLDDDPMVVRVIEKSLGIRSIPFFSTRELLAEVDQYRPMAAFVDIHIDASSSGLEIIPLLRSRWPYSPIIVITNDETDEAVATALASGADDFVRKPLRAAELTARLHTRIGDLAQKEAKAVIRVGDISVDTVHRFVRGKRQERYLSPTAMAAFSTLIQANGTALSREALKRRAWGKVSVSENALDRKICEIRQALKETSDSVEIVTKYGEGFSLKKKDSKF